MPTDDSYLPSATQLGSRLEFETLISDTSASLLAAPPEQVALTVERALERVRNFFRADRCALLSVRADEQVVNVRFASYAEGVSHVPADVNLAQMFPWSHHTLLVERAPIRVSRMADLPPEANVEREAWTQLQIRSALTLPIETGAVVSHIIVLNAVHRECEWPDAFTSRLRLLGEMFVSALERQRMLIDLCAVREELRANEIRLQSGADLAGLGFYEVDFGRSVMHTDDRLRDTCGIPPDRTEGLQPLEFWMEHLHPDDHRRVMQARDQLHSGVVKRLSIEYRYLHPTRGETWVHHLAGVRTGDATGRADSTFGVLRDVTELKRVENDLRDLSRRLIQAHEDERSLLARELHDDLTQRLAVLAIDVGQAELSAADGAHAETLRKVREGLVRLSEDVHALAYQLHPSVLAELGLAEAIRTECERQGRLNPVAITVEIEPLPAVVGNDGALCLFRVVQEALNNVSHHAGARTASVTLRQRDDGLLLAVRDDGIGFDPASPREGRSLGLASMRERVRLVNGTLDVETAPGQGTTIVAWVPAQGEA